MQYSQGNILLMKTPMKLSDYLNLNALLVAYVINYFIIVFQLRGMAIIYSSSFPSSAPAAHVLLQFFTMLSTAVALIGLFLRLLTYNLTFTRKEEMLVQYTQQQID